jgi:hypothetical protein
MKLEKRDITLNEYDSVRDMLFTCERLLDLYKEATLFAEKKELRERLKLGMSETAELVYRLNDILSRIKSEQV